MLNAWFNLGVFAGGVIVSICPFVRETLLLLVLVAGWILTEHLAKRDEWSNAQGTIEAELRNTRRVDEAELAAARANSEASQNASAVLQAELANLHTTLDSAHAALLPYRKILLVQLLYELAEEFHKLYVWDKESNALYQTFRRRKSELYYDENDNKHSRLISSASSWLTNEALRKPELWITINKERNAKCHLRDMEEIHGRYMALKNDGTIIVDDSGSASSPVEKDALRLLILTSIPGFFIDVFTRPRLILLGVALVRAGCDNSAQASITAMQARDEYKPLLEGITGSQNWWPRLQEANLAYKGDLRCPKDLNLKSVLMTFRAGEATGAYQGYMQSLAIQFRGATSFWDVFQEIEPITPTSFWDVFQEIKPITPSDDHAKEAGLNANRNKVAILSYAILKICSDNITVEDGEYDRIP